MRVEGKDIGMRRWKVLVPEILREEDVLFLTKLGKKE